MENAITEDDFEVYRLLVENRLKALYEETDSIWDNPDSVRSIFEGDMTELTETLSK